MRKCVFATFLLITGSFCPAAGVEAVKEPRSALFIGNSYTAQSRGQIVNVAKALGVKAKLDFITPGGCTLQRHLGNKQTVGKIVSAKWDVVVLQEQSQVPSFPRHQLEKMMYPAARKLDELIKKAGARTVFFLTWGRRDGDKRNFKDDTFEKMQKRLTEGYSAIAKELGADVAPAGPAWALVKKRENLYKRDGSHPAAPGAYLNACVFAIIVFGKDPEGMKYTGGLPPADALYLQQTAKKAVQDWKDRAKEKNKEKEKTRQ
jgi:hypothetical protein